MCNELKNNNVSTNIGVERIAGLKKKRKKTQPVIIKMFWNLILSQRGLKLWVQEKSCAITVV